MTTLLKTVTPEMPRLQIVPAESLVLHEQSDDQRSRPLAGRLRAEGVLKNPPLVAPLREEPGQPPARFASRPGMPQEGEQKYVVLDGANRTTAFRQLNLPAILVQIIRYDSNEVRLSTWNHVVAKMDPDRLIDGIRKLDGVELLETNLLDARADLARRDILAYLACPDGTVIAIHPETHALRPRTDLLNKMVDSYKDDCRLYRANTDDPEEVLDYYEDVAALVVFPHYDPAEVQAIARDGIHLPAGITRHVVSGRAMRLNYPLEELAKASSLQEKNTRFSEWIKEKMSKKEVRYYEEPTFLFDE